MVLTYHIRNLIIRVNLYLAGGFVLFFAYDALFSGRSREIGPMIIALAIIWIPPLLVWRFRYWNAAYVFTSKNVAFVVNGRRVWSVAINSIPREDPGLVREIFARLFVTPGPSRKPVRVYWIRPEKFREFLERARSAPGDAN